MKKTGKLIGICILVSVLIWIASVLSQRKQLNEKLIRLHVVANSDSAEDQSVKLLVRDAVTEYLRPVMDCVENMEEAKAQIQTKIPQLQKIANEALAKAGVERQALVTFGKETFDTRFYDTFRLPAGVYESLRITIGDGQGKNWWCVVFPTLCIPATTDGFASVAAGAGFDETLTGALKGEYEIRFFLLDLLGKGENICFKG